MSSEHRNRTNKAQAIAAVLVTAGCTAEHAADMDELVWRLAAETGWHCAKAEGVEGIAAEPWTTVSDATRTEVIRLLAADEVRRAEDAEGLTAHRTDDVFASIAAGSALPPKSETCRWCPRPSVVLTLEGPACNDCQMGRDAIDVHRRPVQDPDAAPVVSTREWLAGINYGALPTESWD